MNCYWLECLCIRTAQVYSAAAIRSSRSKIANKTEQLEKDRLNESLTAMINQILTAAFKMSNKY